jgi:hypothetical protein
MLIKAKNRNKAILAEGNYAATVASVTGKPNDTAPKKVVIGFKIENHEGEIPKELPFSFEDGSPLRSDVETTLGRQFTRTEATEGFDLIGLIGKPCQVVVMHKSAAGGKPIAVVSVVSAPAAITVEAVSN